MHVIFESDWLGSTPFFYNEKTGITSSSIHQVIDYRNLEIDPDGLADYLDFGYCAFGHTPVRHVRFVAPCSRLIKTVAGAFHEEQLPDPVDSWEGKTSTPDEVIERLRSEVETWEKNNKGTIVLPLSGGYDSRLLAAMVRDKSRLRAFTYGVSTVPDRSREVTRAQLVSQRLNIPWNAIKLGDFHARMEAWDDLFGISTHAHGMYHIEFYEEIRAQTGGGCAMLSGLVGDAWAGSIPRLPAESAADLPGLGLSRGVNAHSAACRIERDGRYREAFWQKNRDRLQNPVFQIVEVIRQKMMLLSFALTVPERLGFKPWAPFLIPHIALAMTTLEPSLRHRRSWQKKWFNQHSLDVEASARGTSENNLDLLALKRVPPAPLDVKLLSEFFPVSYLEKINQVTFNPGRASRVWAMANGHPLVRKIATRARLSNPHQSGYSAYVTLKPLETLLRRKNMA